MFKKTSKDIMRLALTGTVTMSLLAVVGSMLPFLGFLLYPAAIPFFLVAKKNGFIFTLPFVTAAYVFAGFSTSFIAAIADVLGPALAAACMGELMRMLRPMHEVYIKGIVVALFCELGVMISQKLVTGVSILQGLRETLEATLTQGVEAGQMTIHMADTMRQTYEVLLKMVPGLIIAVVIIGVLFIFFEGGAILVRRGEDLPNYVPFPEMTFPRRMVFGILLMFVLGYAAGALKIVDQEALLLNILVVIWTLVGIQGLAVLAFLWRRARLPRWILVVVLVLMVFSVVGTVVPAVVGLADLSVNIRGRLDRKDGV